jgi:hypothetical protein
MTLALQLLENSNDSQEKLRLNFHSLSVSELLKYERYSDFERIAQTFRKSLTLKLIFVTIKSRSAYAPVATVNLWVRSEDCPNWACSCKTAVDYNTKKYHQESFELHCAYHLWNKFATMTSIIIVS